jgi:hypothetical protein
MTSYPSNKPQNQNFTPIAVTVGIILLAVIGFLAYNNISKARDLEQTVSDLEESEKLRNELETQYNTALADLDAQKTDNEELSALIDQQKSELEQQKNKISQLLANKGKLDRARTEINNIKSQVSQYLAQIEKLKAENEMLAGENAQLSEDKERISSDLQSKVAENAGLQTTKAKLVSEKDVLASKVNLASIIKMREVKATGQKVRNNGKIKDEDKAKNVDQIEVCFTALSNEVVRPGVEKFYIRIINPIGETLAVEDMGSGTIMDKKTSEEIRFTQIQEVDYGNEEVQSCLVWAPTNASFMKGEYTVEVYNKNYPAGTGTFKLK